MIIEVEDRFCKVAKAFSRVLEKLERAAERGDAVHEVEETTWGGLMNLAGCAGTFGAGGVPVVVVCWTWAA